MSTIRLTAAQALVRYLASQHGELDGRDVPLFAGVWAIFGHGNVAALGEALHAWREVLPRLPALAGQEKTLASSIPSWGLLDFWPFFLPRCP